MKTKERKRKQKKITTTSKEDNTRSKKENIYDKIEKIMIQSAITFGLILLLITWGTIPVIITSLFNIDYKKLPQALNVFLSFLNDIILILILISIYKKDIVRDFKNFFQKENVLKNIKTAVSFWLFGLMIMIISNSIISTITNGQLAANEEAVRKLVRLYPLYMAFQLIIYAPLTEEIIFRKSIRNITNNKYLYIFLTGFIFGGMHVISSLSSISDLLYLIPYCSLGFVFGYLYDKTNNLFFTITAHAFHNTLALVLYLIQVIL